MGWRVTLLLFLLITFSAGQAQQSQHSDEWRDFKFVLGEWSWAGGGQPGQGKGTSSFEPDLNGTVLVRKVHLDYPASKERAAFAHDDVLYVYHDPQDNSVRGLFFDNEGHVIRYSVAVGPGPDSIQFLSDAAPSGTRCRMTYRRVGPDSVTEKFEIAPPGKPDDFATYVEFVAKKISK